MSKRISPPQRIDPDFEQDLRNIAKIRLDKGLARLTPKELSIAEMTRLFRRTNGYRLSLKELEIRPKKENLKLK